MPAWRPASFERQAVAPRDILDVKYHIIDQVMVKHSIISKLIRVNFLKTSEYTIPNTFVAVLAPSDMVNKLFLLLLTLLLIVAFARSKPTDSSCAVQQFIMVHGGKSATIKYAKLNLGSC